MLITSVGNRIWWSILAVTAALTWGIYALLSQLRPAEVTTALLWCCIVVLILYFAQRIFMFRDPVFLDCYGSDRKDLLVQLLPLQLCYFSLILAMAGLYWNKPHILSFCFYISTAGAIMAVLSPDGYYRDRSLLHPPIGLFYLLHGMLIALYSNIGFLGLFPLSWQYGCIAVLVLILVAGAIHLVNLAGKAMGLEAINYFYTLHPGGSGILELLWRRIPIPYLYLILPSALATWLWAMLITAIYQLMTCFAV